MIAREIAEKTWGLWNDYYKGGDLGSKEILDIIEKDIKALAMPVVVGQSEQLKAFVDWWHSLSQEELVWYEGRYVEVFLSL